MSQPNKRVSASMLRVIVILSILAIAMIASVFVLNEKIKQKDAQISELNLQNAEVEGNVQSIAVEQFEAFCNLYNEVIASSLPVDTTNSISLEGTGNYYFPVTDGRFMTLQSVKNYISTVCSEQYTEILFERISYYLTEADGKLYSIVFDGPIYSSNYVFREVFSNSDGGITIIYQLLLDNGQPEEIGSMKLVLQDGKWCVDEMNRWGYIE